jgi:hypothetical protein
MQQPLSDDYETHDLPGIGNVRARRGTSTVELAGAVKYWHDKCVSARRDGFLGGAVFTLLVMVCGFGMFHLLR